MTLNETVKQLKALGSAKVRAQNAKSGAGDNQFGISLGDIRVLAKKIRTNHDLDGTSLPVRLDKCASRHSSRQAESEFPRSPDAERLIDRRHSPDVRSWRPADRFIERSS